MSNLLVIIGAKAVLFALIATAIRMPRHALAHAALPALGVGAAFGFAFFGLFYALVPAIAYHPEVTWAFVTVNAVVSYGATAATVVLVPVDLPPRTDNHQDWRDRAYFPSLIGACALAFVATGNAFVRAFAVGATLMAIAEIAALAAGRAGPVSRLIHGEWRPLAVLLAVNAALGIFYEALNLMFPVWSWITLAGLPGALSTAIMMAIGYIILVHPMFIALRLLSPTPQSGRQPSSKWSATRRSSRRTP